jgi:GT2 family glycosyltransferase
MMLSYNPSPFNYLSDSIGYVEQSTFIKVNKRVRYPTWQMSSVVGVIHASVLLKDIIKPTKDFNYFLNSLAKHAMPKGLFCYSEPKLLKNELAKQIIPQGSHFILYKFVKEHYKLVWLFLLFFNELFFDKRVSILPLIKAFFYKTKRNLKVDLNAIEINSSIKEIENISIDVLIPTLGRKEHLHNVLIDLSKQILLPKKVIIVEQNGLEGSVSELDYLNDSWPFEIDHTFIHQLGACNARNIALSKVTGNWVFFADDDIRFEKDLLSKSIDYIKKIGVSCLTISCLQKGEIEKKNIPFQWSGFGTNASLVESKYIDNCSFKPEHEFGYGEDSDFGMQLKNNGCDIIYLPFVKMLHLKAPIGGFRAKFSPMWKNDAIQPKPSPTVMAYNLKHLIREQLKGYKTLLFLKFYKKQSIKNPIVYLKSFNKRWDVSIKWAKKMMEDEV